MKLISLISGGIDSPVATYLMMKKGADIVGIYFDNRPFCDEKTLEKTTKIVEKLFEEIAKNGNFAYGFDEVKNALDAGAIETLLVTDKLVRTKKADELLEKAKKTKSKFMIISTVHDSGKKLEGLGGVGALLRYKIS